MGRAREPGPSFLGSNPHFRPHGDLLPLLALLDPEPGVAFRGHETQLVLQLDVAPEASGVEAAIRQRGFDRASRLGVVRAIGEPALKGQQLDVLEDVAQTLLSLPPLRLARAGRGADQPALRTLNPARRAGRMPP